MSLNTTPRTWVAGEVPTAANFNTEVRDAIVGIQAAWTAYTPTLAGITLGNGTVSAAWIRVGKTVHFRFELTVGSTTTIGAGPNTFSLPVSCKSFRWRFLGDILDNGSANYVAIARVVPTASTANAEMTIQPTAANQDGYISSTAPITFVAGDVISFHGTYEAA